MLERQVPDREGLKLGIACLDAVLVLVIELRETDRHLARARTRRGYHDQTARGFDIIISAVALVADDQVNVCGIVGDRVVMINVNAVAGQTILKFDGGWLVGKARQHHGIDQQAAAAEHVDQTQHVEVIGNAQIAAHLVLFDIVGIDNDHDLGFILQLHEHLQLGIGLEPGQNARGVIVVKQLAAKLEIELVAELGDAVADVLRLGFQVLIIIKSYFHSEASYFSTVYYTAV